MSVTDHVTFVQMLSDHDHQVCSCSFSTAEEKHFSVKLFYFTDQKNPLNMIWLMRQLNDFLNDYKHIFTCCCV